MKRKDSGTVDSTTSHRIAGIARCGLALAAAVTASTSADAGDVLFAVTGTISIKGDSRPLPDGGTFGPSSYDDATGMLAAGAFSFPEGTITFQSNFGPGQATYVLTQNDESTGVVDADGSASLSDASLQIDVTSATVNGFPVPIGTCVFSPIVIGLQGSATADGLQLADPGFAIPEVASSDCGGYGDDVNNAIAGDDNSVALLIAGDFPPPSADEGRIFADGFDG